MKSEEILMALGDVNERYIEESAPKKKKSAPKWETLAAGLLLVCGITVHLLYPPRFETFLARYEKGYYQESSGYELNTLMGTGMPVGNHFAFYWNLKSKRSGGFSISYLNNGSRYIHVHNLQFLLPGFHL
jgi:hypothetical protein